jgi:uncharacterized protein
MTSPCFIDTSALIALLNPRDQYHTEMEAYLKERTEPLQGILSNLILTELLTFFSRHGDLKVVLTFQERLMADPLFELVWVDQGYHHSATQLLKKYRDQNLSFVDASSFAIMKERRLETALSFDDDFKKAGFGTLP